MIHGLAVKTAKYLIGNDIGQEDTEEDYVYGLELAMEKMITFSVIFILALYFKLFFPSVLFLAFFIILRGYTGGYHADTFAGCFTGTLFLYIIGAKVAVPFLVEERMIASLALVFSIIFIGLLAPMNHPNLNLDKKEIKFCKKGIRAALSIELAFILGEIICKVNPVYIVFPLFGILMCAMLLIIAKIIKQEV